MVSERTSPNVTGHHSVDVQTVIPNDTNNQTKRNKRMNNNQTKLHGFSGSIEGGGRRPLANKTFNRQVSLGTGVTVLGMDKGFKETCNSNGDGSASLHRSGTSLGNLRDGVGGGVPRKGDFSMFRTKSTLNKQNSLLPSRELDPHVSGLMQEDPVNKSVPAGRYFAALRGPELDEVRDSEDILLPKDEKWPFLLRFPIGCFGICLGLGSQAILWGAISSSPVLSFLHITPIISLVLWVLALTVLVFVATTYSLKCMFYFEAIRREYFHPVRVNFFFAPWIACMFLAIGLPPAFSPARLHPAVWCAFVIPVFALELKIYGQWLSGGKRRLCKVANPSSHLSVVGNFVGAILAAKVGWLEVGRFMWAIGLAHYLCVFVTLYQRLPTNEALPKELHPVYSMFVATPSAASIAWKAVYGEFDAVARSFFFIALFLYISLVVRIEFFRGFRFSVAWWSYTFPMTTASLASIRYAEEAPCFFSKGLALGLSMTSSTMVALLFVSTLLHAFVWRSLFPNDLAIAITKDKNNAGKQGKKSTKKTYDIKRWAKQAPFSLVSSITKSISVDKDSDGHLTT
ncbi:hypothetical protein LUZ63_002046 [Rhynchospora breviuscula]|uniref:Uncharacterized protein n=1 Tax=Rhynchospora breviuscula TaxID=2022672 RepID=A0A9Q0HXM9_9POAL|nr:hypothetical protein LUZ63_002046 [Rhynchospora breviuscula]